MSALIEKARRQFEAGKHRSMVTTLWYVEAEVRRDPDPESARELLDLALTLREHTSSGRVARECDSLARSAQEILDAGQRTAVPGSSPMATIPPPKSNTAVPPPKSNTAALIILSIVAAACLILFLYVRTLTTVSHALLAGWYLKEGPALIMQVVLIAIFFLCVGLAIRSVVRMANSGSRGTTIEGPFPTGQIGPNSGPLGDATLASQRLRELASLHEQGLISDEEFASKRAAILDEL